jgi:hypothetical protein
MKLELIDSRRLTGANLFWDCPSAILDVAILARPSRSWRGSGRRAMADAVGYADQQTCWRLCRARQPADQYADRRAHSMCELNETAWATALHAIGQGAAAAPDPVEVVPRLVRLFDEERNPRLLALQAAARERGAPFLWDDDEVSLGLGRTTQCWKPASLPAPEEVDWASVGSIPVALVTRTNRKTTTVRMAAAIKDAAGFRAGLTTTHIISVGERVIDTGDYSGTGGARMLLRQPDVEMAVLEVARGGLLRRGLGVERASVALITNVAADHLGEYGIHSVAELILAKFIVHRALAAGDRLVLNADDEGVVAHAESLARDPQAERAPPSTGSASTRTMRRCSGRCYPAGAPVTSKMAGWWRPKARRAAASPRSRGSRPRWAASSATTSPTRCAMSIALAFGIDDRAIGRPGGVPRRRARQLRARQLVRTSRRRRVDSHPGDFAHNAHGMQALAKRCAACRRAVAPLVSQAATGSTRTSPTWWPLLQHAARPAAGGRTARYERGRARSRCRN